MARAWTSSSTSARAEQIPLDRIVSILDQLCAVLHEAHGHIDEASGKPAPIIHRDLKPSNLMLVDRKPPGQDLKVLDFGIAKMLEEDPGQDATLLTGAGDFLGTPAFMSPEQIRGGWGKDAQREVDGRSDLYSTGVLLYQLITGKLPFQGRDPRAMMAATLAEQPRPMKVANPKVNVPAAVERVVIQCLDKDPAKRPQNAQELAQLISGGSPFSLEARPVGGSWRRVPGHRSARLHGLRPLALVQALAARSLWQHLKRRWKRPENRSPRLLSPGSPSASNRRSRVR